MRLLQKFLLVLMIIALLCCCSCSFTSNYSEDFFAMDTVMSITAYGKNSESAVKAAEEEINSLDRLLSVQNENSEIYLLNKNNSATVSDDTAALLNRALKIYEMTDGSFDITSEPLSRAWGFYSGLENRVPSQNELQNILNTIGTEHININKNNVTLDSATSIDLGGIAKGYASSKAAQILKQEGITSALLSLGGNVRAVGKKPDGTNWNVAIVNPDDNNEQIGMLSVNDKAVITSGGYQRFFEENGQIYHHIIDTKTGYPANSGLKSVTVVSDDDTLADALSTALFVMGLEKSTDFYFENSDSFGAVFVTDDNDIFITENLADDFSSQLSFEVIKA